MARTSNFFLRWRAKTPSHFWMVGIKNSPNSGSVALEKSLREAASRFGIKLGRINSRRAAMIISQNDLPILSLTHCLQLPEARVSFEQMKASETAENPLPGAQVWPLSVAAYHVLGEAGLIPKRTELLYGFVYHKIP